MPPRTKVVHPFSPSERAEPYSVGLGMTEGRSDKVYHLAIEPAGELWVVNYAYGARGDTLRTGTKTTAPVDYATAAEICSKELNGKVAKGYLPESGSRLDGDGVAEAIGTRERKASGFVPQLLVAIVEKNLEALLRDPAYVAQPKHNGHRRGVVVANGDAFGSNRKGETVALSPKLLASIQAAGREMVLDGEQVGDRLYAFDIHSLDGIDVRPLPYKERMEALARAASGTGDAVEVVESAYTEEEKRALLERIKSGGGEGIVLKRLDAPYTPGRPESGGSQFKFKLWQSLSAIVGRINDKRSVGLELLEDDGRRIDVGNVTIPANHSIPAIGSIAEIRYLFANEFGGLIQPNYEGPRTDLDRSDCLASQRVFEGVSVPEIALESEPAALRP